jgi:peroxiredoxin
MTVQVGDPLPHVNLAIMGAEGPQSIPSATLFSGKRVVLFALPGAFTPTCSARHLPGYLELAEAFRARGVDRILCLAVNDVFVMDAWGREQGVGENILMVADGNGDFVRAAGLEQDLSDRGFGLRARRCALLVQDGVVEALRIEEPGQFQVSDAESMLALV